MSTVGIIGLGFVGSAILKSFKLKGIIVEGYDKFKNGGIGDFKNMINKDILFFALPTLFDPTINEYNKNAIYETCDKLIKEKYSGIIIIKSTIEPATIQNLNKKYPSLKFIHNPEFLTARTAFEDFHNQSHIVLGIGDNIEAEELDIIKHFYSTHYPTAEISTCKSIESESMKIFCNSFYASKIQILTEYYMLCQKNGSNFDTIIKLMLKNKWINPMHTLIPGPDGLLSYGGNCFPKDTNALLQYMKSIDTPHGVLENIILERNDIRES